MSAVKEISLPSFSGPLDLLLHLIERSELDITAISLAKVAAQYLAEVEELKKRDDRIEQLIEFLVIGAQLALIKSRALLPQNPITAEDEANLEDPAEALARRLRAYKVFKETAAWLKAREKAGLRTYIRVGRAPVKSATPPQLDLSDVNTTSLQQAMIGVLLRAEQLQDSVKVAQKQEITIEQQMSRLRRAAKRKETFGFDKLLSNRVSRAELSVTLLAVLECVKRREVTTEQTYLFGPIDIVPVEAKTEEEEEEEANLAQ